MVLYVHGESFFIVTVWTLFFVVSLFHELKFCNLFQLVGSAIVIK